MKRFIFTLSLLLATVVQAYSQNHIRVEAPDVVAVDEQFNVTFIIEGENNPSDFTWSEGDNFQLVWGPQKGTSTSIQIINGKRSTSHQTTFTYILMPKSTGTFSIPAASASIKGDKIYSSPVSVQVVSNGSSQGGASQSSGQSSGGASSQPVQTTGEIQGGDLFLNLSLSRKEVVLGEPITATLKLYQRVDIAGFENAKFPSFNGFWSQETYSPTNIEFKRESFNDKIYNSAILRSYVLIPQQAGTITIDPAELVCLVNVRTAGNSSSSIFDSFFQDDYKTIRKRVTTSAVKVKVLPLPAGQPASFGGGVGNFSISARLTSDQLKTHDAASLIVTVTGHGNVALLEEPKVTFPPDFETYDTKTTENTDKSNGGTSGSKSFEYPFIPRSHGDFTIEPVEYSYYDVEKGKYVTIKTQPMHIKVAKGKGGDSSGGTVVSSGVDRNDVKSLADDIRFISTKMPVFRRQGSFLAGSPLFLILLAVILLAAIAAFMAYRKYARMRADVAGAKNRRAGKMAQKRLKLAGEYLNKNLYTAFYEELHKALIGFISDKLDMDMSEISKDNISSALMENGASEDQAKSFTDLLDACEFARYSSEAVNDSMKIHYDKALSVISDIDSSIKGTRSLDKGKGGSANLAVALLVAGLMAAFSVDASAAAAKDTVSKGISFNPVTVTSSGDSIIPAAPAAAKPDINVDSISAAIPKGSVSCPAIDSLWALGVRSYSQNRFNDAAAAWGALVNTGLESAPLYCNLGDAFFKEGNYARAILNYEKALKLDPSYSEARYNLEFANRFVPDKIEPIPEFILLSFARKVSCLLSSNAWAAIFLVLLVLAICMALLFILASSAGKRRTGFYCGIVLLLLSLCAIGFSCWQKAGYSKADSAIVMAPVTSVKSSPSEGAAKDLFIIHEGTKVKIIDEVGEWRNVSLADGRQGWIPSSDIEII